MCVCVCVIERERDRERQRNTKRVRIPKGKTMRERKREKAILYDNPHYPSPYAPKESLKRLESFVWTRDYYNHVTRAFGA